jgi:hypothetical protein
MKKSEEFLKQAGGVVHLIGEQATGIGRQG